MKKKKSDILTAFVKSCSSKMAAVTIQMQSAQEKEILENKIKTQKTKSKI